MNKSYPFFDMKYRLRPKFEKLRHASLRRDLKDRQHRSMADIAFS